MLSNSKGSVEGWFYYNRSGALGDTNLITGDLGVLSIVTSGIDRVAKIVIGGVTITSSFNLVNLTWYHISYSWDVNGIEGTSYKVKLYVNNIERGSSTSSLTMTTGTDFSIVALPGSNVSVVGVDEVIVWGKAKTSFNATTEQTIVTDAIYNSNNYIDDGEDLVDAVSDLDNAIKEKTVHGASFFISGNITAGQGLIYYIIPKGFTAQKVKIGVTGVPTGSGILSVDVNYHATDPASVTTIFTQTGNKPALVYNGALTDESGTPDVVTLATGGIISVSVDEATMGSGNWTNLMVTIMAV
jgi:hypothetical protein